MFVEDTACTKYGGVCFNALSHVRTSIAGYTDSCGQYGRWTFTSLTNGRAPIIAWTTHLNVQSTVTLSVTLFDLTCIRNYSRE
jgi:hypothetical protein